MVISCWESVTNTTSQCSHETWDNAQQCLKIYFIQRFYFLPVGGVVNWHHHGYWFHWTSIHCPLHWTHLDWYLWVLDTEVGLANLKEEIMREDLKLTLDLPCLHCSQNHWHIIGHNPCSHSFSDQKSPTNLQILTLRIVIHIISTYFWYRRLYHFSGHIFLCQISVLGTDCHTDIWHQ